MDPLTTALVGLAVAAFGLASWAMHVKLRAQGRGRLGSSLRALAFAGFQFLVMGLLVASQAGWALVFLAMLLLATGTMFLDALAIRYPHSRPGAWWAALGAAAAAKRATRARREP